MIDILESMICIQVQLGMSYSAIIAAEAYLIQIVF